MKKHVAPSLIVIGLLLLFLPNQADACSCVRFTPCEAFGQSPVVFIGQIIDATEKVSEHTSDGKTTVIEFGLCTFSVEEVFKGVTATEIKISVLNMKGTSCEGMGFVRGVKYIVYADYSDSRKLLIGPCSPTTTVEHGKEHIEFLRNLPKAGAGGRLYGHVVLVKGFSERAPMAGITMIATNQSNEQFKTLTNRDGYYEITGLKPGRYTVEPVLPEHHDVNQPKREVEVSDRGCTQESYGLAVDGSVSGRVVDLQGRTAPARLTLVSVENEKQDFFGYAKDDGEFEIDEVPPGRYFLYLGIASAGKDYPGQEEKYFYPGTFKQEDAKVIEIGLGQKLNGYGFTLPAKLKVQVIQGVVKYADGKLAVRASVLVSVHDRTTPGIYRTGDLERIDTDGEGRFEFRGFKGNTYELEAHESLMAAARENRKELYSDPMKIKLDGDVKDVQLVLSSATSKYQREKMEFLKKEAQRQKKP